jgi:hypothetical protein
MIPLPVKFYAVTFLMLAFASAFAQTPPDAQPEAARRQKAAQKPKSDQWTFSFLPVSMQKNPQVEFTIITEMTDEGRKLPAPNFAKPVYYISHAVGQRDVGDGYAGTKSIQYEYLEEKLNNALMSNGYRPADAGHAATQVLFIAWGRHTRVVHSENEGIGEEEEDGGERRYTVNEQDIRNLLSRAKIVGGQKFADEFAAALKDHLAWTSNLQGRGPLRRFAERDDLTETLVEQIFDDCYYLLVSSFEVEALKHNEKKLLWHTKISTSARGLALEDTMSGMIENGAYYLGREMSSPDIVRKRAYKKATVEIGEATVVEQYFPGESGASTPAASGTASGTTSTSTP